MSGAEAENRLLRRAIETITSSLELDEVLAATLELVTEATGGDACFLLPVGRRAGAPRAARRIARSSRTRSARCRCARRGRFGLGGRAPRRRRHPRGQVGRLPLQVLPRARRRAVHRRCSRFRWSPRSRRAVGVFNVHSRGAAAASPRPTSAFLRLIASLIAERDRERQPVPDARRARRPRWRTSSARPSRSQEEERRRVATEIHDGVTQQLVSIWYRLQACGAEPSRRPRPGRARAGRRASSSWTMPWRRRASRSTTCARRSWTTSGWRRACARWRCASSGRGQCRGRARRRRTGSRLPPHHEVALYRIAQEAVTNVRKHANAGERCASWLRGSRRQGRC